MRIGYVANAFTLGCKANRRFRLASYSEARLMETVNGNLSCLDRILQFNARESLRFFRISSDLVPFASHPVCKFDWARHFEARLASLGSRILEYGFRISMHPGQYTILNAPDRDLLRRSIAELEYHQSLLDTLGLDSSAKIQIHVGGVYGDKGKAMDSFCNAFDQLNAGLRSRLVIENDDVRFSLSDCLAIHSRVGIPVVFDVLHHECLNSGEPQTEALGSAAATWGGHHGVPMVDYSSQQPGRRTGVHAEQLDERHFREFLTHARGVDPDVMLELRDKDLSALKAVRILREQGIAT